MAVMTNVQSKGSNARLIATASANQTYATQCSTLYSVFQTLTLEEKLNSIILINDVTVLQISGIIQGGYSRHGENPSLIYGETINLQNSAYYESNGTTVINKSTTTNSGTMKLYVLG